MTFKTFASEYTIVMERAAVWQPEFYETMDIRECADAINKPHEDYPAYVDNTVAVLELLSSVLQINTDTPSVDKRTLFNTHSAIFKDREDIALGKIRLNSCHLNPIGSSARIDFPEPQFIDEMLDNILPVSKETDLIPWYSQFENIHPFEDGNGRVGGVIVAALHHHHTGKYLCPKQ